MCSLKVQYCKLQTPCWLVYPYTHRPSQCSYSLNSPPCTVSASAVYFRNGQKLSQSTFGPQRNNIFTFTIKWKIVSCIWLTFPFRKIQNIFYAGCNDEFDDIFLLLSPIEINNNIEFSLDNTSLETTEFLEGYVKLPRENLEDGITKDDASVSRDRSSLKKRGRPKVVSITDNLLRERRDAANARERKRMNQMTRYQWTIIHLFTLKIASLRAYKTLRSRLPNNEKIVSKKQIVDQVRKISTDCLQISGDYLGFVVYQGVEISVGFDTKP